MGQLEFDVNLIGEKRDRKSEGGQESAREAHGGILNQLDLSDWMEREDSSGTVLGMLPLRRATSLDQEGPPDTSEKPKGGDTDPDPPKK